MQLSGAATPGSGEPARRLAKFGCVSCREQHLKCDRVTPTCGRCLNARRECRPPGLKIRVTTEHKFKFTRKQKWVKTPRRLVFIDESKTAAQDVSSPESGPDESTAVWSSASGPPDDPSPQTPLLSSDTAPFRPRSPTDRFLIPSVPGPSISSLSPRVWPLANHAEAFLFRHFVEHLASWLDLCDPNHTFTNEVPQRARDSPVLLNAIFALSARHLGQTCHPKYNQYAVRYNAACLEGLLENTRHESGWTEDLFAAAIILQVVEEMNAMDMPIGVDDSGHLKGMYSFIQNRRLEPGSLAAAAFWVGLRQDIYSAVRKGEQVRMNLVCGLADRSLGAADDYTWANRAIVHCADVLNFCFGPDRHRIARWHELNSWNDGWGSGRPSSFDPFFRQDQDSAPFPEVWYHGSYQVIGVQHHLLAKLFLLDHRLKTGSHAADKESYEKRIRDIVREICGIGLGNQWTPPGMFTACMAIAAFGSYFGARQDQSAMLGILERTQKQHARPTEHVIQKMIGLWGWTPSSASPAMPSAG